MSVYANQSHVSEELRALHTELESMCFIPGWNRAGNPPMWSAPKTGFLPRLWSYEAARRSLLRAGDLVSPDFAERRNVILANPAEGQNYPTSRTHVLAYQMTLPGERARTHRHSPHAGRLVLEADEGAYTVVDGVKLPMYPGDVLLTPGWHWHGHGHDGSDPALWIDFLDVPLVQMLDPMFFERYPGDWQEPTSETRESPLLFPYERTVALLDESEPDPDGYFGRRVQLGAPALPTTALYVTRLESGTKTRPYQATANYQYCVIEGSGTTWISGQPFSWKRGDIVVVPCWSEHWHEASEQATFLTVTDEPVQQYCGYLRTAADLARGDGRHVPPAIARPAIGA